MTQPAPGAPEGTLPTATDPPTTAPTPTPPAPTPTPAPQPAPAAPAPAAPAPSPLDMPNQPAASGAPQGGGNDFASLPEWAQAEIRQARDEAKKARLDAKAAAAEEARKDFAAKVAAALGMTTGDEPPDPAKLTEQLQQEQMRRLESELRWSVHNAAGDAQADEKRLLDSVKFIESLDHSVDADPGTAQFDQQVAAAIRTWVRDNPEFKVAPPAAPAPAGDPAPQPDPAPRSSAPISGSPGENKPITEADLKNMSPDDIATAYEQGRLAHLM